MTSQDIADLVGSQHGHLKTSIERLASRGVIHSFAVRRNENPGIGRPSEVYVFEGEKGKRDSIIVVAQNSPEFTARLVDRWQELEQKLAKPAAPANLNDAASACMVSFRHHGVRRFM
ncbi:Rha family transcriptional regulator [Pseudomonas putida]|uniref:Rha family transcriptional regulator n=1 Tax=Pseudomonas putida TaxID=303 RepID=UPI000904498C|nr:Rha family transcriptional regulator [Pseudomonas putida]